LSPTAVGRQRDRPTVVGRAGYTDPAEAIKTALAKILSISPPRLICIKGLPRASAHPVGMDDRLIRLVEGARVPRYTSYPTAPHFTRAIGAEAHAAWLAGLPADAPVSLYLHIPYCREICWYCGCTTRPLGRPERAVAYADLLTRELDIVRGLLPGRLRLSHLHWGGGTPTVLGRDLLRVMDRVGDALAVEADAELAIEIDPRVLERPLARDLGRAGFTRASLGVQSFEPEVQRAINRIQSFACTADAVEALRGAGIAGINIDLLYGLPHETAASARLTAERLCALRPERVAVFGYAHLPALLKHQRMIDEAALPGAAERVAQFEAISEVLGAAGYRPIGLDHFALPEDGMARAAAMGALRRNFQGYTTDRAETLIGLGCSAIGAFPQGYAQAHARIGPWREAVLAGRLPTARGIRLSAEDRARRAAIEAIMCHGEVDLAELAGRLGLTAAQLAPAATRLDRLRELGVVEVEGPRIAVRAGCRPLLRLVAAAFDRYLAPEAGRHALAV
jgi:oxygen-independent coproporphyrinogen-3 oxidase